MTNGAAFEVVVTPVIALPGVVLRVVPEVKNVPVVGVTLVTTVCGGPVKPVTNVPVVGVTLVTTAVFVVVPFRNGTVSKGPIWPGLVVLVNTIVPLLLVVVVPLDWKANVAFGGALLGSIGQLRRSPS